MMSQLYAIHEMLLFCQILSQILLILGMNVLFKSILKK